MKVLFTYWTLGIIPDSLTVETGITGWEISKGPTSAWDFEQACGKNYFLISYISIRLMVTKKMNQEEYFKFCTHSVKKHF